MYGLIGQKDIDKQLLYKASVYSMDGTQLMAVLNQKSIEVSNLSQGTYILEIQDLRSGQKIIERIVVGF